MALPFFSLFIVLVTSPTSTPLEASPDQSSFIDVVGWTCTNRTVPDGVAYWHSYWINIQNMKDNMQEDGFVTHEDGDPPQRIFVLSQCVSDLSAAECIKCWSRATDLLSRCSPNTGGRVYLNGCFVRADNFSFYHEALEHDDWKECNADNNPNAEFGHLVKQVTDDITEQAPLLNGFSLSEKGNEKLTVYGLGMCWNTLDEDMCRICLADGALSLSGCLPSGGGSALNAGCYLRYSDHPFHGERGLINAFDMATDFIGHGLFGVAACVTAVTVGFWVGKCIGRNKHKEKETAATYDSSTYLRFKYSTLVKATDNFNEICKLGVGGYGEVFKGTLPDGREIAIKRLHRSGKNPPEEIINEIAVINRCQHKNLVRLLGCCFTNINSFLIYEFLANTSLDHILFHPEKKKELDWKKRQSIILGTAEGLEYLHEACLVIHRDIKASNILLDLKYKPKISDFGLAKSYPNGTKSSHTSSIAGTLGYMAPEYISKGTLTHKIDVYSFGVLVLELTSSIRNNKFQSDNSLETLVTRTWKCFTLDKVEEMIDKDMQSTGDVKEIKRVIQIGLLCTQVSPDLRPSMSKVIEMLIHADLHLPSPTKPPFIDKFM